MTVSEAVIEQTIREFCATEDRETAITRISIWLAVERREGAIEALRVAAKAWRAGKRSLVTLWLNARADKLSAGGQL